MTITNPDEHVIIDQQPTVWPECPTCHAAWAYKRALSFTSGGFVWLYMRDCEHKSQPVLVTADGPYKAPDAG